MTRVAAIDCGTNSIRLLIADVASGGDLASGGGVASGGGASGGGVASGGGATSGGGVLDDVVRRMEIVRLGAGVDRTGRLSAEALERTRVALRDYAAVIAEAGVERVRMVATSATRDASNAEDFRAMVVSTLGVEPVVVSGDEEARLSFDGAVRGLPPDDYLVVDIGGGSTEFVTAGAAVSVDIGCVRMTERYLHSDPPSAAEVAAAAADIGAAVERALAVIAAGSRVGGVGRPSGLADRGGGVGRVLVGLAGSVTTVVAIALGLPAYESSRIHHARVSYEDVARVTAELLGMTRAQRLALPVMHPGRADVIGAGALILRIVLERTGAPYVVASEHDILDGIAYSLASPS